MQQVQEKKGGETSFLALHKPGRFRRASFNASNFFRSLLRSVRAVEGRMKNDSNATNVTTITEKRVR
jgi:hypothetical protein